MATDCDNDLDHGNRRSLAILPIGKVSGIRAFAMAVLAVLARHAGLLRSVDANRKGLAIEEIVDLKVRAYDVYSFFREHSTKRPDQTKTITSAEIARETISTAPTSLP